MRGQNIFYTRLEQVLVHVAIKL